MTLINEAKLVDGMYLYYTNSDSYKEISILHISKDGIDRISNTMEGNNGAGEHHWGLTTAGEYECTFREFHNVKIFKLNEDETNNIIMDVI